MWVVYLVIGTTIWVGYDANANQVPVSEGAEYSLNTGAVAWVLMCLLLWIVSFPYYLVRRSHVLSAREGRSSSSSGQNQSTVLSNLERLGELKSKGILTEAEFEKKKLELLSR
jgi:hypothetical protein